MGHFGLVPVTLIVLPFLTQVMVFFLEIAFADGELLGEGDIEGCAELSGLAEGVGVGEADGVGMTISAALCEGEADAVGVLLATATGARVGNKSLS
jgi:hypothetical protein